MDSNDGDTGQESVDFPLQNEEKWLDKNQYPIRYAHYSVLRYTAQMLHIK